jgi:hypothetical protein
MDVSLALEVNVISPTLANPARNPGNALRAWGLRIAMVIVPAFGQCPADENDDDSDE